MQLTGSTLELSQEACTRDFSEISPQVKLLADLRGHEYGIDESSGPLGPSSFSLQGRGLVVFSSFGVLVLVGISQYFSC